METVRENLRKFSKVIYIFSKICFVGAIVGVCLTGIAMLYFAISGHFTFEFSFAGVTYHGLLAEAGDNTATIWGNLAYALTYCIFLISVMRTLMRLFANMRDNYTPFTMENANLFRRMAIKMILASVIPATVGMSVGKICERTLGQTFNGQFGDSLSIIAVLLLFAMSIVFKYGCALQEQADTTL